MSNIDSEMSPEQEAATYAELSKLAKEKTNDQGIRTIKYGEDGEELLEVMRMDEDSSLGEIVFIDYSGRKGDSGECGFNESGELISVADRFESDYDPKPNPQRAARFLEALKTGTVVR